MQNLFDKASLVMVPSGYDNGKLYNIKPEDKGSAFEFERSSMGTRVNSDGLIEFVGVGEELATATNWSNGPTYDTNTGTLTAINLTSNTSIDVNIENNETYLITYTIVSITSAGAGARTLLGGSGGSQQPYRNQPGTYREVVTYPSGASIDKLYFSVNGTTSFEITDISLKQISNDTPRIDYSSGEGALLLEPQRSNLLPSSEAFSIDTYWSANYYNRTANSTLSPFGLQNATLISEQAYTGVPSVHKSGYNISLSGYNTFSIYVKLKNNARYFGIAFGSTVERIRTTFDFENNTFKTLLYNGNVSNGSASYEDFGNGWYKIIVTAEWGSSISNAGVAFAFLETDTYLYYLNQTSDNREFYVWGAQIEGGSYPTSYIPTNGQQETRAGDVCGTGGYDSVFNNSQGTLYMEFKSPTSGNSSAWINLSSGTDTDDWLFFGKDQDKLRVYLKQNNVVETSDTSTILPTNFTKASVTYNTSSFKLNLDGVEIFDKNISPNFANNLDTLSFGSTTSTPLPEKIEVKTLCYFPEALTDEELQRLTSPSADATTFTELANNNGYTIL